MSRKASLPPDAGRNGGDFDSLGGWGFHETTPKDTVSEAQSVSTLLSAPIQQEWPSLQSLQIRATLASRDRESKALAEEKEKDKKEENKRKKDRKETDKEEKSVS